MLGLGLLVSLVIAGLVAVLQALEEPRPSAWRNILLVLASLALGAVAAGLAIAFAEIGQWGNWEYNMPWILGLSAFAIGGCLLKPRHSELVILWWSEAMSFLSVYGIWEEGPGDEGMGALLTVIMSAGCLAAVVVLILSVLMLNLSERRLARSRRSDRLQ
ncbi:hypothetical protein WG915_11440 [Corynebacterium sp. H128]|uniref:hypothetical protein n=1 Tax=unclassified Corynebacterium TaxID=2624378 RepID=UPI0030A7F92F